MLATMQRLGVAHTRSRLAVSNDNPYVESAFRTLKYRLSCLSNRLKKKVAGRTALGQGPGVLVQP